MTEDQLALELGPDLVDLFDSIRVFDQVDSTNSELIRQIKSEPTGTRIALANSQTAGRGRRGRQWQSPANSGIYLSVSRPFTNSADRLQSLSLVTGLSVINALAANLIPELLLKWPNDILFQGKKLAGILLELQQSESQLNVVFGIGINVALPERTIAEIDRPVTDLYAITGKQADRPKIVATIVRELFANIQRFEKEGFAAFQSDWNRQDNYLDKDVVIHVGEKRINGRSLGVDQSGALVLQTDKGKEFISGGEIIPTLRGATE